MKPPRGLACKLTRYWHYDWPDGEYFTVETVPGHQSACFAGERQEKRGLK